jgi:crotonobetainyl-CoA:carnitine CoA-transferase CaiB-like acyl-CoA transferase
MPAFGSRGPFAAGVGYGCAIGAMAGIAAATADGSVPRLPLADPLAGLFGALAAVVGVRRHERDGCGRALEVAQRDVLVHALRSPA